MTRTLTATVERFPVRGAFVIARGAKTHVDVVVATITDGETIGRGEATAIYYRGETAETVVAAIIAQADAIAGGASRAAMLTLMPAGAARNAVDAALWDLEAKRSGRRVWQLLGLPEPKPLLTAFTISLGDPGAMAAAAHAVNGRELLKIKLGGADGWQADVERIAAVRCAGQDALLDGVRSAVPLAADESCHDRASLDAIVGRYSHINIKLDKAGGLTEAHALVHAARARGLGVMTGCMLSTSLGIAPAFAIACQGQYADLDGPLLIMDRPDGLRFDGSDVWPPEASLWG